MLEFDKPINKENLRKKGIRFIDTKNNSRVLDIKFRNLNLSDKWDFSEVDLNEALIQPDKRGQIEDFIFSKFPREPKYFSSWTEEFDDYYDSFILDEFELCSYIVKKLKGGQIKSRITILENSEIIGDLNNPDRTELFETIFKNKNTNMLIFGSDGHYGLALFDFDNNKINVVDFDLYNFIKEETRETSKPEVDEKIFGKYSNTSILSYLCLYLYCDSAYNMLKGILQITLRLAFAHKLLWHICHDGLILSRRNTQLIYFELP